MKIPKGVSTTWRPEDEELWLAFLEDIEEQCRWRRAMLKLAETGQGGSDAL